MKILPNLTVIHGHKQNHARRAPRNGDSVLFKVDSAQEVKTERADVYEVVSLENKRAFVEVPPRDLGAAEALLRRIKDDLGQISQDDLRKVHRLEGLLHFYTP